MEADEIMVDFPVPPISIEILQRRRDNHYNLAKAITEIKQAISQLSDELEATLFVLLKKRRFGKKYDKALTEVYQIKEMLKKYGVKQWW